MQRKQAKGTAKTFRVVQAFDRGPTPQIPLSDDFVLQFILSQLVCEPSSLATFYAFCC